MGMENAPGHGSMFGVVDSMQNMTRAMAELLQFLPKNFVWPTRMDVSPFIVITEWGRSNLRMGIRESVWLMARPDGVRMQANFRPDLPDESEAEFDAATAAGWLQELTKNWKWDARRRNGMTSSSISTPGVDSP